MECQLPHLLMHSSAAVPVLFIMSVHEQWKETKKKITFILVS